MAKYEILNAAPGRSFTTKTGKGMTEYMLMLKDEAGATVMAGLGVFQDQPAPSGSIEGEIESTQYGPKFKKAGGFGGNSKFSPENQAAIIRQNALTNAVQFCLGKAQYMGDNKEVLKYLTGKEVIQVATYFAKFSKGEITVVSESKPTDTPAAAVPQADIPAEYEQPPSMSTDEINLEDIPL